MSPQASSNADGTPSTGTPFVCSWSGGKDATLALDRALRAGGDLRFLFTMMAEGGERSRSHGLRRDLLATQAERLNVSWRRFEASWESYEETFVEALSLFRDEGVEEGVFGDLDVEAHRTWVEGACKRAGLAPRFPLWKRSRSSLFAAWRDRGFRGVVIAVRDGVLPRRLLGRSVDDDLFREIRALGADASGEAGEYHTLVTGGPPFSETIGIETGEAVLRDGVWFLDVRVEGDP